MLKIKKKQNISFFERYLTVWVLLCMGLGILISQLIPSVAKEMESWKIAGISIPIALLIWAMIYPVMLKIDFKKVVTIKSSNAKGLLITTVVNWLIKPFTMYGIAMLFFKVIFKDVISIEKDQNDFIAGLVLLAAAPCTAMVFVWSSLVKGNPNYTLSQVILNDLILLGLFAPIVGLLLQVSNVTVPWDTLLISMLLFVAIPLALAVLTRFIVVKKKSETFLKEKIINKFEKVTMSALLLTLVIIFIFQGKNIWESPKNISLILIPITIQCVIVFALTYFACYFSKVDQDIAGPASTIGTSNFFELALAVAIAMYGATSNVALAVIGGIIVEVPIMLIFVKFVNRHKTKYIQHTKK